MRRTVVVVAGAVLVAGGAAGGWHAWRAHVAAAAREAEANEPDADGFVWRSVEANDGARVVVPAAKPPANDDASVARGPHLLTRSTAGWTSIRTELTFSSDGKTLRLARWSNGEKAHHQVTSFDLARRELVSDETGIMPGEGPPTASTRPSSAPPGDAAAVRLLFPPRQETATAWSADGSTFAIVIDEGVFVWRRPTRTIERLGGGPSGLRQAICSPDGKRVGTDAATIVDVVKGSVVVLQTKMPAGLREGTASWRASGAELDVAFDMGDTLSRFETVTGRSIAERPASSREGFRVVAVDGDWAFAKKALYGRAFEVSHVETGERRLDLAEMVASDQGGSTLASVAVSEDGRWLGTYLGTRLEIRDFREKRGWRTTLPAGRSETTLAITGSRASASRGDHLEVWDLEQRRRIAQLDFPPGEGVLSRRAISHGRDRVLLRSGRIASLANGSIVSDGPARVGRSNDVYASGCWGEGDRWIVLAGDDVIVLHRPERAQAKASTLLLHQFRVATGGVELLVMTPDGRFDGPDTLLETIWFRGADGALRRASNLGDLRERGLLARFHEGN